MSLLEQVERPNSRGPTSVSVTAIWYVASKTSVKEADHHYWERLWWRWRGGVSPDMCGCMRPLIIDILTTSPIDEIQHSRSKSPPYTFSLMFKPCNGYRTEHGRRWITVKEQFDKEVTSISTIYSWYIKSFVSNATHFIQSLTYKSFLKRTKADISHSHCFE